MQFIPIKMDFMWMGREDGTVLGAIIGTKEIYGHVTVVEGQGSNSLFCFSGL